jgi:hypothetical protein
MPRADSRVFTMKEGPYEKNTLDSFVAAFRVFSSDSSKGKQLDHYYKQRLEAEGAQKTSL